MVAAESALHEARASQDQNSGLNHFGRDLNFVGGSARYFPHSILGRLPKIFKRRPVGHFTTFWGMWSQVDNSPVYIYKS
jgi:hypothetical protein